MPRVKRSISFLLLFVFASLFAKNILPTSLSIVFNDCNDIAHIHNFRLNSFTMESTLNGAQPKRDVSDSDDCHAGKSVTSSVLFTGPAIEISFSDSPMVFGLIYSIEPNFLSPFLEPNRKPPRSV